MCTICMPDSGRGQKGTGGTISCELPDMGGRNETQVLCKSKFS